MKTHTRNCPDHLVEVNEDPDRPGIDKMVCPEGHYCDRWLVMDPLGHVVGVGYAHRPGVLLPGFAEGVVPFRTEDQLPPDKRCTRCGVNYGWVQRSDGRWRCRRCLAEQKRRQRNAVRHQVRSR